VKPSLRNTLIGILVVVVILAYFGYSRRFEISAMMWHWKNGDFLRVGKYEVPVPSGWLVKVLPSGLSFLTDTRNRRNAHVFSGLDVITLDFLSTPTTNLDSWKSSKEQWLKNNGVSSPEERSLSFEDEAVACVGGHEFHEIMQLPEAADLVSIDCRSSGRLHLMFVGQLPDVELFYSLIPKIRKQK
jgi:hypothetical protein